MARVLRIATNRSLILIDEFPKSYFFLFKFINFIRFKFLGWHCNIWEFNIVFKIGFVFIE